LLSLTAPDSWGSLKGSALYAGLDYGPGNGAENINGTGVAGHVVDKTHLYVGAVVTTPVTGLKFGAAWDTVNNSDLAGFKGLEGYASAMAAYVSYHPTDSKLTINGRAEYAHGSAFDFLFANNFDYAQQEDKVIALTGTVQYDLWANVISRLEVRWDHSADGSPHFGDNVPQKVGGVGPGKSNELMVAANVIYKF